MYSFPNLDPVCCSMSVSNCCFFTCIQISQKAGEVIWYSHLLKNFPQFVVIHTVKGFGVVKKAEVDVLLELSWFFNDPTTEVGNLIFDSSAFSKSCLNIWNFMVHVLLKPGLENFEHYFAHVWGEYNCAVVWAFFGTEHSLASLSLGLEWKLTFSSPVATAEFSRFAGIIGRKWKMKWCSRVPLFVTSWAIACQAPLFIGFSRQEYWSGLLFPSPGNLPDLGIKPGSPALQAVSFTVWATREGLIG